MTSSIWPPAGGGGSGGSGDVTGPGASVDNAIPKFDGTTGKLLQGSGAILDDSNNLSGIGNFTLSGDINVSGNVDGRDVGSDGATLDNLNTTIGLGNLTTAEVTQLTNINLTTISETQWGYLGALDQSLTTSADVDFNSVQTVSDVIVGGDLIVNGTTTTINTADLAVTDKNITVNNGGNDTSAEGAGLTIERTGTDGSFVYEDALASKFKAGALGSEIELANISSTQTLTNKSIDSDNNTITNIVDANIKASAGINVQKLSTITANRAVITDASGYLDASTVTDTELSQLATIDSTTISATQWGYLGELDQALKTTDDVSFSTAELGAGTAALPSLYFNGDTNTGLYQTGGDGLGFSASGSLVFNYNNTDMTVRKNFEVQTGNTVSGLFQNGRFTPTGALVLGGGLTFFSCMYSRVGNIVTYSGFIEANTDVNGEIEVRITLPITSNFSASTDAVGAISPRRLPSPSSATAANTAVFADTTNNQIRLALHTNTPSGTDFQIRFCCQYEVK